MVSGCCFGLIALLLTVYAPCSGAVHGAPSQFHASFLDQFGSLAPQDRLAVLELLVELQALQQGADSAGRVEGRLQQVQQHLTALLPHLQDSGSNLVELKKQAAGALAADLAPRGPSKLARAMTLVNIVWFCGCVLLVVATASLVGTYLAAMVLLVPLLVWEALGYAASVWVLQRALHCNAGAPYVALTGLLMFTACAGGTIALHGLAERFRDSNGAAAALMAFYAVLYGALAVRLQASLLGTIAVWWAVSALGFSILVFPFLTVIGFRSGVARPFAASLVVVLAFLPFKAVPVALPMPSYLRPFETGVWLWCPLVLNVANLIMAHRKWDSIYEGVPLEIFVQLPLRVRVRLLAKAAGRYLWGQVPSVAVIGGTLACGVALDVEQCRAVGATFGFLWFLSKLSECDWGRVGFAWAALAFGGVLWASAYAVHTWPEIFMLGKAAA